MDKNISHLITEACRKNNIYYRSCNPNYITFSSDAQLLVQLYKDMLDIVDKLTGISDRHEIPELKKLISFDIDRINEIDHDLIRLSRKIREEEND
jgi:hypothetical protein